MRHYLTPATASLKIPGDAPSVASEAIVTKHTVRAHASYHGADWEPVEVPAGSVLEHLDRRREAGFDGRLYWEFVCCVRGVRMFCTSFTRPI